MAQAAGSDPATVELISECGPAYAALRAPTTRDAVQAGTGRTRRTRSVLTTARRVIQATRPLQIPAIPSEGAASTATAIGATATR
jgi:hypothetical protein